MTVQRPRFRRILGAVTLAVAVLLGMFPTAAGAATAWSTPVSVSVDGLNGAGEGMQLTVAPNGNVVGTWAHFDGSDYSVQVAVSTDGGSSWGSPATISDPAGHAEGPKVVINGSGAILVYWVAAIGNDWQVQISTSTDGGASWSNYVAISNTSYSGQAPVVVADGDHGFVAAYQSNDGANVDMITRTSNSDGATWSNFELTSSGVEDAFTPALSENGEGTFEIVWFENGPANFDLVSVSSSDGGLSWTTPVDVVAGEEIVQDIRLLPTTGVEHVLLWARDDGASSTIFVQRSTSGGTSWNAPIEVVSGALENSYFTGAAGSGVMAVAWVDDDGTTSSILFSSSQDSGSTWSTPQTLATTPTIMSAAYWAIRIVVSSQDSIAVTWSKISGNPSGEGDVIEVVTTSDGASTWSPIAQPGGLNTSQSNAVPLPSGHFVLSWVLAGDGENAVQTATSVTPTLANTGLDAHMKTLLALLAGTAVVVGLTTKKWGRLRESNSRPIHYE